MKRTSLSLLIATVISTASFTASAENTWKEEAKDAWLDGKAESTLLFNGNLNSFDINTDVQNGTVILTGKVDTSVDKALAEELVSSLDGVEEVENELTIVSPEPDADDEMMQDLKDSKVKTVVKTRLLFESEVSGLDIEVEVDEGVVTLAGTVTTDSERQLAIAIAENTEDVSKVVDKLTLES